MLLSPYGRSWAKARWDLVLASVNAYKKHTIFFTFARHFLLLCNGSLSKVVWRSKRVANEFKDLAFYIWSVGGTFSFMYIPKRLFENHPFFSFENEHLFLWGYWLYFWSNGNFIFFRKKKRLVRMIQIEQKIIEIGKHIYLLDLLATVDSVVMFRRYDAIEWEPLFYIILFLRKRWKIDFLLLPTSALTL